MDYGSRIKEAAKTVHSDLINLERINLVAVYLKIRSLYGIGERAVNKHLEQLEKLSMIQIKDGEVIVLDADRLKGLLI